MRDATDNTVCDFTLLADSLELKLGRAYLEQRGSGAFVDEPIPVPWEVHNNGVHAAAFCEVLSDHFTVSASHLNQKGERFSPTLAEFGVGVGLFASQVLDFLRSTPWYDHTLSLLFDSSLKMLTDIGRRGVLQQHTGRYRICTGDARDPSPSVATALSWCERPALSLVVLNYLLDCLPTMVLRSSPHGPEALVCRTVVSPHGDLARFTPLLPRELARLAQRENADSLTALTHALPGLAAEYAFEEIAPEQIPHPDFALRELAQSEGLFVHSYGAIDCLTALFEHLSDDGFVFVSDYDSLSHANSAVDFQHQRYTASTFVAVNFRSLEKYFESIGIKSVLPNGTLSGTTIRLFGRAIPDQTARRFQIAFDPGRQERTFIQRAQQAARDGTLEHAWKLYRDAAKAFPHCWTLADEIAHFLINGFRHNAPAARFARAAMQGSHNTSSSPWIAWGIIMLRAGYLKRAIRAFRQALRIKPSDALAYLNLAIAYNQAGEFSKALDTIALALTRDRRGVYRDRLLAEQTRGLTELATRWDQEQFLLNNRIIWSENS